MSRKGNCYDNATVESFFHTLKVEWLYRDNVSDFRTTELKIFRYIEGFYNTRRLHSAIGYLTPKEMKSRFELLDTY
ncbi:MAG: transposase [Melioribacteraceae bacterium]|nr:transposase [Melioribacteraceae bacterium]